MNARGRAGKVAAFIRQIPAMVDQALINAAAEYAGIPTEGGGVSAAGREGIVGRRFTRSNTHGYPALSARYAAWKRKRFGQLPILVRTGALKKSLSRATIARLGRGRVRVSFPVPFYGHFHHAGAGGLPVRSPVEPNAEDRAMVRLAARKHADGIIRRRGAAAGVRVQ